MTLIKVAILTVSDSCYSGHVRDKGAANLKSMIEEKKLLNGKVILEGCVPDAVEQIKSKLTLWSDEDKVDLILTTGGTGFAPRDVTPEATKAVLQKEAPGLMLAMLKGSLEKTHFAMLSRPACGIRGRTLIINLPGSRTGSAECFGFLLPALPHAFDLLNDRKQSVNATHDELHGVTPPTQEPITEDIDFTTLRSKKSKKPVILDRAPARCRTRSRRTIYKVILPTQKIQEKVNKDLRSDSNDFQEEVCSSDANAQNIASTNEKESKREEQSETMEQPHECANNPTYIDPVTTSVLPETETDHQSMSDNLCTEQKTNQPVEKSKGEVSSEVEGLEVPSTENIADNNSTMDDEDNTLDDSNDYSNPRSTESLDMECHESGEDTVIVMKEKPRTRKRKNPGSDTCSFIAPKLHKAKTEGKVHFVPVGESLKRFLECHSHIQGIYLNRGKRAVKRKLVSVLRQENAVDTGSWKRGSKVHERNRLDDMFELTEEGARKLTQVRNKAIRDEYVVNWYLWCPGYANCQHKCGSVGSCIEGCKGMKHKQDRHNCSLLLNLKLFLSNLSQWRVHISGNHLPEDSSITWQPPAPEMQKMGEDVKDVIFKYYGKESNSNIAELLVKQNQLKGHDQNSSKRRVSYFVSSMKKRRRERNYAIAEDVKNKDASNEAQQAGQEPRATNYPHKLKQLSDQQIIDVLKESDGQALGFVISDSNHARDGHIQGSNQVPVTNLHEQPTIVFETGQNPQGLAVHYLDVGNDEGNLVQYHSVPVETTVYVKLDTDHAMQ